MLKIEIANAIDENNTEVIANYKKELIALWNSIISIQPKTTEERKMLGLFLIDQLTVESSEHEIQMIRKKIVELFWEKSIDPEKSSENSVVQLREVISGKQQ